MVELSLTGVERQHGAYRFIVKDKEVDNAIRRVSSLAHCSIGDAKFFSEKFKKILPQKSQKFIPAPVLIKTTKKNAMDHGNYEKDQSPNAQQVAGQTRQVGKKGTWWLTGVRYQQQDNPRRPNRGENWRPPGRKRSPSPDSPF